MLFFGPYLNSPSHLWMRRMLTGLGRDVTALVDVRDPGRRWMQGRRLVVLADAPPTRWRRVLRRAGLRDGQATEKLRRAVSATDVSVVLVHFLTEAVTYADVWRATDKPVFVHCHGYDVTWDLRDQEHGGRRAHAPDYADRVRALPENVRFIANSHETKRRLTAANIAEQRISVNYLGVPVPEQLPSRSEHAGPTRVLFLGRLVDCKGPDLVIRAFERACELGFDGSLTLAGDGPLRLTCELLRARSAYAEQIELLGAVDGETGEQLRRSADIVTAHNCRGPVSRQEEAFGVSIVEAMAAGLPIVSGRSGSLPELIDDGQEGILIEPGDVEAHAQALLRLGRDPALREQMGQRGWQRARARFSVEDERIRLREILGLSVSAAAVTCGSC